MCEYKKINLISKKEITLIAIVCSHMQKRSACNEFRYLVLLTLIVINVYAGIN